MRSKIATVRHCFGARKVQAAYALPSVVIILWIYSWAKRISRPNVKYERTVRNELVIVMLQSFLSRRYVPNLLTPDGNFNSGIGYVKISPKIKKSRELVRTWDGGNFALDWRMRGLQEPDLPSDSPILIVIHGINGHSDESYVLYAMDMAHSRGWRTVAFNHRGCGGSHLSSPWGYSGAFTGDLRMAINHIHIRYPNAPIMASAYSLGANLLVKCLGEDGRHGYAPLTAAVAVSNPWNFEHTHVNSEKIGSHHSLWERIVGKTYGFIITLGLRLYLKQHSTGKDLQRRTDVDLNGGLGALNLVQFDKAITVPMWGYNDLEEYHKDASSRRYLADVKVPLLCINAEDDPLISPSMWPSTEALSNPNVIFVSTKGGGHIGWCQGINPLSGSSWADDLLFKYLDAVLCTRSEDKDIASSKL